MSMAISMVSVACDNNASTTEKISKELYEAKIEEYKALNKKQSAIIDDNLEKSKVISGVVAELRQLTGVTTTLRRNVETGVGELNQAEEIKERLAILKQKLKSYSADGNKSKGQSEELLATIANLQQIIVQKEEEISQLQQQIRLRDETIRVQKNTIDKQQEELLSRQQNAWFVLGKELYEVAGELPKVKGRKDKKNIKNTKYYILNKSKECFEQASQLGHFQATEMAKTVNKEMENL